MTLWSNVDNFIKTFPNSAKNHVNWNASSTADTADSQFRILVTYNVILLVPSKTDTCGTKTICLSYNESTKKWEERQGPTLGVHFFRFIGYPLRGSWLWSKLFVSRIKILSHMNRLWNLMLLSTLCNPLSSVKRWNWSNIIMLVFP